MGSVDSPISVVSKDSDDDDSLPKGITYYESDEDLVDLETTCPGQKFKKAEEVEITQRWLKGYLNLCAEHAKLYNEILMNEDEDEDVNIDLPPRPLNVLPVTTDSCIRRGYCYHREYMTNETSETSQTLGYSEPHDMLQVLSLRLLHTESCPINVYGIFAIRDDFEPLRNYVFNRTRDDPVMIAKDSFALPLCSPCRGMYVLDNALLEVDLWMKNEGDRSTDEQLLSVYVEFYNCFCFDEKITKWIHGERCMLDMSYMFLAKSVEATIQVSALVDNPSHVRFMAFGSCFDDKVILFKGEGITKGELIRHVVAVKSQEKLGVRLELGDSVFDWLFQDGTKVSRPSHDLIMNQFQVKVFFAPKKLPPVRSRYFDWKVRCGRSRAQ